VTGNAGSPDEEPVLVIGSQLLRHVGLHHVHPLGHRHLPRPTEKNIFYFGDFFLIITGRSRAADQNSQCCGSGWLSRILIFSPIVFHPNPGSNGTRSWFRKRNKELKYCKRKKLLSEIRSYKDRIQIPQPLEKSTCNLGQRRRTREYSGCGTSITDHFSNTAPGLKKALDPGSRTLQIADR
jgi:hypothetical protein